MIALVLGATGFIGGHIARAALDQGWTVRGLRRNEQTTGHLGKAPIQWLDGDLMNRESLLAVMQGSQVVFHAAAFYPKRDDRRSVAEIVAYAQNEIQNVIETARQTQVARIIYTSTLTTIGHPPHGENRLANETDTYQPGTLAKNAYYEAKVAMEAIVLEAVRSGFPATVLNPTAVFGPGDVHLTLGGILLAVARGRAIAWIPATVNVVDVRDVAQAHIQAVSKAGIGQRYILGGHNQSVRQLLTDAALVAGVPPPRFAIPLWLLELAADLDDALPFIHFSGNHLRAIRYWQGYDISKAKRDLSLETRPFNETVRDALDWFRQNEML